MSRAKFVDYYLAKLSEPGFEIDQIRKELQANNIEEEEIRVIVRIVDNELQRREVTRVSNEKQNALIWFGGTITGLGLLITIGTYTGLINTGNSFIIAYGPMLAGISILITGLARRRR